MAPNEKEDTEDPFGLPEEEPTQVEYIEEENESSETSTEVRHDSEVHKKRRNDARQRSGSDARQRSGSDTRQRSGSDTRQRSGSDIDTSVYTERRSESMHQEQEYPERQPPEQPKPRNTSTREAPKREAPKREAPKKEGFTKPTEQRASRRMTRSQRAQVLDESANVAAQNIQEDDPLTYEEAMAGLKKQS
ncbi:hypothetical protein BDD12DRAFT_891523 [Trichophaea hybrida]|nr:hypothetical protein BDD12DRAFT_891523 [Trichophaea hybrida]